jgi:hypothetical protein
MYITININNFDIKNIFYDKKQKNIIIKNSNFIRLGYSNNNINLNGIYLNFNLNFINTKYNTDYNTLYNIENNILNSINIKNYIKMYSLNDRIKKLNITTKKKQYMLKISGIWLNEYKYGLIFKIYDLNN